MATILWWLAAWCAVSLPTSLIVGRFLAFAGDTPADPKGARR
jgi:hypothetical protein